jgi:hypothetical protein
MSYKQNNSVFSNYSNSDFPDQNSSYRSQNRFNQNKENQRSFNNKNSNNDNFDNFKNFKPKSEYNGNNKNVNNKNENNKNEKNYNEKNYNEKNYSENNNDIYIKQQLINYIYSTVELANFNYKLLEYESDLNLLTKDKFFVSANYSGSNCLLVFIKVKEKYLSYLIDRKTLSYNKNAVNNPDNVKIIQVNVKLDESIYKGTILNGIFIQTPRNRTFVITDAYYFRGQNTTNDKIQYKIMNIVAYLKANLKENPKGLQITVNKLYDMQQTETLINETIPQQKNLMIKGIAFYPEISGTRLIFMFNNAIKTNQNIDGKSIDKKEREKQNENIMRNLDERDGMKNKKVKTRYVCKTLEPVIATFELKKTDDDIIDVYRLYSVKLEKQGERSVWKSKNMGMALIPTKECSLLCRNIFAKNDNKVFMKCKFISEKNKWQPIEEDTEAKIPSNIEDIENKFDIVEEDNSDDEI